MGGPKWLDAEEMRVWQGFLSSSALLNRRVEQQLKRDAGLSHPQFEILVRLSAAPDGELRMTELADAVLTSKSGLSYQVTQLEEAGLVCRRSSPEDDRGVLAALTTEGGQRLAAAAPGHVMLVRELLIDVLSREQITVIAEGLGTLARRLSDASED